MLYCIWLTLNTLKLMYCHDTFVEKGDSVMEGDNPLTPQDAKTSRAHTI